MSEQSSRPPREHIRAINPARGVSMRAADGGDGGPILYGHFARFNEWTEIDSWFEGNFMERVAPGAFRKTLAELNQRVLLEHGNDPQLGNKPIAEPIVKREDDQGAYYEARLFDGLPDLVLEGLRAGQYGASFRFSVMREEYVEEPGTSDHNPKGIPERTLTELRVPEFGPVTWGAYDGATAGVRSLTDDFIFGWLKREPRRARELMGAIDLSAAAMAATEQDQQDAPSADDAAREGTSSPERRDSRPGSRYGLARRDPRPSWAL